MELHNASVLEFIRDLGSSAPAPGGGSVAAMNGAMAAALIEMVANLTIGNAKYEAVHEEMKAIQKEVSQDKEDFVHYINKDSAAFMELMGAFKLPKETDEEKVFRKAEIQRTTKQAALVPYEIGKLAYTLLPLTETVIVKGNTNAITDGMIAVINARAAVKSAFLNVKINLGSIQDAEFVKQLADSMEEIEAVLDAEEQRLLGLAKI